MILVIHEHEGPLRVMYASRNIFHFDTRQEYDEFVEKGWIDSWLNEMYPDGSPKTRYVSVFASRNDALEGSDLEFIRYEVPVTSVRS